MEWMIDMRFLTLFLAFLLLAAPHAQARIVESFKSGSWHGDAFVSDETGQFDSCIAIAKYKSGISMSVQVDANYDWWIGFSAPGWKMTPGQDIPLQFKIDRGQWQQGVANAVSAELARMPMPSGGYIITRFRRGRTLYVYDGTYNYQFRLTGTSRLMARLARCVEKNAAFYGAGLTPNSGSSSGSATSSNTAASSSDATLQVEATQVIFNLMGNLSIQGLDLIDADSREENIKGIHAYAKNDARAIAVHIRTPDSYESEKEIIASMISESLKTCEGEFTARAEETFVDDKSLLTGGSSCLAGDVELVEEYAIAKRSKGGVLVYAISDTYVGEGGGEPVSPKVELKDGQFAQAVVAVSK